MRVAWTDERLDDLANRMDAGFERVDRDIRDLRSEVRALGTELRGEFRSEIADLRTTMTRFGTAIIVVILGAIAAQVFG